MEAARTWAATALLADVTELTAARDRYARAVDRWNATLVDLADLLEDAGVTGGPVRWDHDTQTLTIDASVLPLLPPVAPLRATVARRP